MCLGHLHLLMRLLYLHLWVSLLRIKSFGQTSSFFNLGRLKIRLQLCLQLLRLHDAQDPRQRQRHGPGGHLLGHLPLAGIKSHALETFGLQQGWCRGLRPQPFLAETELSLRNIQQYDAALVFFAFLLEVPPVFLGFSRSQAELLLQPLDFLLTFCDLLHFASLLLCIPTWLRCCNFRCGATLCC